MFFRSIDFTSSVGSDRSGLPMKVFLNADESLMLSGVSRRAKFGARYLAQSVNTVISLSFVALGSQIR